jgi:hypothetical protein
LLSPKSTGCSRQRKAENGFSDVPTESQKAPKFSLAPAEQINELSRE